MTAFAFDLSPDAVSRMHDVVICLAKFSEVVALEAMHDKVSDHRCQLLRCSISIQALDAKKWLIGP